MNVISAAGLSDTGCQRQNNEDRILVNTEAGVFILADGIGGEQCGEVAAELAVNTVGEYLAKEAALTPQDRVLHAARMANREVWTACRDTPECEGMGTTLSVLCIDNGSATIANVGDSRVYLARDNSLRMLTRDDAVVTNLLEAGQITSEEAKTHPMRNALTSALGYAKDIAIQMVALALAAGDRLLLCSDGLHGVVEETNILRILTESAEPLDAVRQLVVLAKNLGGPDNVSCIVVHLGSAD